MEGESPILSNSYYTIPSATWQTRNEYNTCYMAQRNHEITILPLTPVNTNTEIIRAAGSFLKVVGRLSKNVGHHVWLTKNNWLKVLKQSPKQRNNLDQNLDHGSKSNIWNSFFENISFRHTAFLYSSTRSSGHYQSFFKFQIF